jgi:hypothetical protein
MMEIADYYPQPEAARRWTSLRQVMGSIAVTLLAIVIALSLPAAAQYALREWWPHLASDANLLFVLQIGLAAALVLLFNLWRLSAESRLKGRVADTAALVYARHRANWLTRLRERSFVRKRPAARDAFILTLTGYHTFVEGRSLLREPLQSASDIRVMLLNPAAPGAEKRINTLPHGITLQTYMEEVEESIGYLAMLRGLGKNVTLKFYEHEPFWKVAVLGDHLWVQYCRSGFEVKGEPEYVFALNRRNPRLGLFVPFYRYFLEQWGDTRHPHYDFDTRELVYHDVHGRELRRARFTGSKADTPALLHPKAASPTAA